MAAARFLSSQPSDSPARTSSWWIVPAAVALACLYLPMLGARFDFIDDGNLVYPASPMPLGERIHLVWEKIIANYEHLGPFRPALWMHWELAAELTQGSEFGWRLLRLAWCAFAAAMFLWLLRELGFPAPVALMVTAAALWNRYRSEIWTSLTLAEGIAMPYAILGLVCARRGATSRHAGRWDAGAILCALVALGCKNTFAALVPAQVFLRLWPDGLSLGEAWRRNGLRALLPAVSLLLPVGHFLYFKSHWHPGQYETHGPSLARLGEIAANLLGASGLEFLGLGLAFGVAAWWRGRGAANDAGLMQRHRAALGSALLLVLGGVAMYLPMRGMSARYSMPGVWGLDLGLAVLLAGLWYHGRGRAAQAAWVLLLAGLVAGGAATAGREMKFMARSRLLWDALEYVEKQAPRDARVGWMSSDSPRDSLNAEEGIHFQWHLERRGRRDVVVGLFDESGQPIIRSEVEVPHRAPDLWLGGCLRVLPGAGGDVQHFRTRFWAGRRSFDCYLWQRHNDAE
jgi:hypothetical protein